ncbi:MAG: HupE/UreJ family protein, partial [Candidatus Eisenbacteria bacterium]|nr:HupE/UreJ family protein [Candidatus Eisenbacteria bacterium]
GIAAATRTAAALLAAFAIGQAIALWAGYFGVVRVPSQWASVALALSVFAIAWNNLRPFAGRRAPAIVGFMGACHGLAMSGALANMALPTRSRVVALGGFHLGVELAMLVVCVLALPVWFAASRSRFYPRVVMGVGSLAIAWMAVVWVLERAFSLALFAGR